MPRQTRATRRPSCRVAVPGGKAPSALSPAPPAPRKEPWAGAASAPSLHGLAPAGSECTDGAASLQTPEGCHTPPSALPGCPSRPLLAWTPPSRWAPGSGRGRWARRRQARSDHRLRVLSWTFTPQPRGPPRPFAFIWSKAGPSAAPLLPSARTSRSRTPSEGRREAPGRTPLSPALPVTATASALVPLTACLHHARPEHLPPAVLPGARRTPRPRPWPRLPEPLSALVSVKQKTRVCPWRGPCRTPAALRRCPDSGDSVLGASSPR